MTATQKLQQLASRIAKYRPAARNKVSRMTLDQLAAAMKEESVRHYYELVDVYAKRAAFS